MCWWLTPENSPSGSYIHFRINKSSPSQNHPSFRTASYIFPTDLYLRDWPATSPQQLAFSSGERFGKLHLMWDWDLQVNSLMSFILGLLLLWKHRASLNYLALSFHLTLLLALETNLTKLCHSSVVTGVKNTSLSKRRSMDSCIGWPLFSQCSEWVWKLLIQTCKRDFLTLAKLFTPSSSLAVSELRIMLALFCSQLSAVMAPETPGLHWNRGVTCVGDQVLLSTDSWEKGSIGKWYTEACVEYTLWQPVTVILYLGIFLLWIWIWVCLLRLFLLCQADFF